MPTTDIEVCPHDVHHGTSSTPDHDDAPKHDQHAGLRRVAGPIPWLLFLICVVEFGERFVYFGVSAPLQNYIQHPYPFDPDTGIPGALNRGQAVGSALGNTLKFWSYLCTVFGAIIADQWLGKFKTILASSPVYILGMVLLVATATPAAINSGASFGGLIASIIMIGLGTGGLKSCIAPLCGEQNTDQGERLTTLRTGEVVIVDGKLTTARIFLWYYWAANIGCLSALITVPVEKAHSFWLAYLIPLIVFMIVLTIFVVFSKKVNKLPPQGSPILDASNTIKIALREKSFDNAKPSVLLENQRLDMYSFAQSDQYTDSYVEQVKTGLLACKYFLLFPFFTICWTQIFNNLISQAGEMDLGSTPNDLMQNLSTVFMLAFIPLLDLIVYPALRKANIDFNPVRRITLGFFCASLSMVYACVLQHYIYTSPPASIDVWIQAPGYIFGSLSEIWVLVTGIEIAFNNSPENLRAVVTSVFWVTIAVGAAIGIALTPVSQDPYMVWTYGGIAVAAFLAGCVFWICFRDGGRKGEVLDGVDLGGRISRESTKNNGEVNVKTQKL